LIAAIDPVGRTTEYFYSGNYLSGIKDPANRVTTFGYSNGYLTSVNFPDGTVREYGYSADGLLASETDERGNTSAYIYNQWGRIQKIVRPDLSEIKVNDIGSATAANNYVDGASGVLQSIGTGQGQIYNEVIDAKGISTKY